MMSGDVYANALRTTLTEIRSICPDITHSFIFTKEGEIVAEAAQDIEALTERTNHSFQDLIEKTDTIGGLKTFLVNGNKGVAQVSQINNMFLALSASKKADIGYIQSVAGIILPSVMKLLENIVSTPLKPAFSSQNFKVENLTGLFTSEATQIDNEILKEWAKSLDKTYIDEIEIEAPNGKIARCKTKAISDHEFQGKGLIRIPEKICRALEVKKGDMVKVRPVVPEGK